MKPSIPKPPPSTTTFILLPIALLAFLCFFLFPFAKELKLQSLTTTCRRSTVANLTEPIAPKPDFRLFMGIITHADHYERRHLLRLVYSLQPKLTTAHVDIRFVFCNLTKEDQRVLVALEIMRYDDILILNCTENMDSGKTYAYFSTLPKLFNSTTGDADRPPYDYVMKADDDIYFRLGRLAQSLKKMPRHDLYYGCAVPCDRVDPYRHYMSGMGYVLSWDLVEWISTSEISRNHTVGPEDLTTWTWLRDGNLAKDKFDAKPAMYNYPSGDPCAHDLVPDTIAVHQLKDNLKWARTLKYFKVTDGLKPSKLYHIS
ncbi:beta-1,3-galactosyltransferase pvg3-like [Cocos nucifera]|uniref:Hexosyltransferase n=1 Tax=Cocos nucifera TaxID=13894 RepID=A0A8K0HTX3_COCNU|nr:beta-1,3-galactosyltransferase pvg3-like [Cocos nucifera]